eukprot:TRINITY_DN12122_c0_g1_i1.p1 TRINITY_DN12122_c0_g1~~TRINITY_DN12122_c0_g1_i1.p1  ORF type:complete len:565 (-),score=121.79 TRINITY_DN12122_c0_g1_i1:376-2070(-)
MNEPRKKLFTESYFPVLKLNDLEEKKTDVGTPKGRSNRSCPPTPARPIKGNTSRSPAFMGDGGIDNSLVAPTPFSITKTTPKDLNSIPEQNSPFSNFFSPYPNSGSNVSPRITVLKYKTNYNPYSPGRDQPVGSGSEIQIPTEKEASVIPRYVSEYEPQFELGRGSFGTVVMCLNRTDGWVYAVKKLVYQNQKMRDKFLQEAYALAALGQHPNVVRYYSSWEEPTISSIYIQTEWCKGGSLKKYMKEFNFRFGQAELCRVLCHISKGLEFLHSNGFSHGDVKPDNILIDTRMIGPTTQFKLSDLGQINDSGDGKYLAPEVLAVEDQESISTSLLMRADVFSLGITLLELALITSHGNTGELYSQITQNMMNVQLNHSIFSLDFSNLLRIMMDKNPNNRPNPSSLVQHTINWDNSLSTQLIHERNQNNALKRRIAELEIELNSRDGTSTPPSKRAKKFDMSALKLNLNTSSDTSDNSMSNDTPLTSPSISPVTSPYASQRHKSDPCLFPSKPFFLPPIQVTSPNDSTVHHHQHIHHLSPRSFNLGSPISPGVSSLSFSPSPSSNP